MTQSGPVMFFKFFFSILTASTDDDRHIQVHLYPGPAQFLANSGTPVKRQPSRTEAAHGFFSVACRKGTDES